MKNYDLNLLVSLYKIHSPSGGEKKMRKFIKRQCAAAGATFVQDKIGNLYVTKGVAETYPCIVAHTDQVQHLHSKDFQVLRSGNILFGYSPKCKEQQGLGADDKNGIWIALSILREVDVLKCAFFVQEEVGCVGSSAADMEFFKDVRFIVEPDRRNGSDLITNISGNLCSEAFLGAISYDKFGYVPTQGMMTDVETLSEQGVGVSCINISCGYYHPHTDKECTDWEELKNACDFARNIVDNCTDVYPHTFVDDWHRGSYYGRYGGLFSTKKGSQIEHVDMDTMRYILEQEPHLTLDNVWDYYEDWFYSTKKEDLREVYRAAAAEVREMLYEDWNQW